MWKGIIMFVLQCINVCKSFGADEILSNVKLEIKMGEKVALVGRNGAGKSTLLKIIAGQLSYDSGELIIPKDVKIGYLDQHTGLESNLSIWDEMMTVFAPLKKMEQHMRSMEAKMADEKILADPIQYNKLLKEYDETVVKFKDLGGYQYESDIRTILAGMNFADFDYDTPISALSGGQKTRLALAKLLLQQCDLLVLDEPTNHLDIETLTWLEQFLANYKGALLVVSHDRYFLDKVVTEVIELSRSTTTKYHGNYSDYLSEKAKRYEQQLKLYEKQQTEVAKIEQFIQRNIARASTTKRAQSRRKQLQRMELIDRPKGYEKSASFSFDIERQSGNDVLRIRNLSIAYDDKTIVEDVNLHLDRGEAVALIGDNGVGKSTLLKAIVGKIPVKSGTIEFGSNVSVAYYDQEQADIKSNKQVLHELWDEFPHIEEKEIRTVLGNFLFSGDDVLKPVSTLSGGERARLALAKLMMEKANLLILDEPTNHLDIDAKEVLEAALIDYPGTILFVSHDRYFLNRISTRTAELANGKITIYLGDYDYYVDKKTENELREKLEKEKNKTENEQNKSDYEEEKELKRLERRRKRRIEEIEKEIETIENEVEELEQSLYDPEIYNDHKKAFQIQEEIEQKNNQIEQLMEEWEQLLEQ